MMLGINQRAIRTAMPIWSGGKPCAITGTIYGAKNQPTIAATISNIANPLKIVLARRPASSSSP